ncbi:MAG: hypothetical protein V4558_15970 [Gemmatimonadota bacterium]
MLQLLRQINGIAEMLFAAGIVLVVGVGMIGGRRGLRNPWVYIPLSWSLTALCFAFFMAYRNDLPDPGTTYHRLYAFPGLFTFVVSSILVGPLVALWAGFRRGSQIDRLIHAHEFPVDREQFFEDAERYRDTVRARAIGMVTRADLEALLPLVRQTGGAPGYDWLTVDWVQEQLAALPSPDAVAALASRARFSA